MEVRTWRRGTIFSAIDSLRALSFMGRLSSMVRTPSLESKRTSSSGRSLGTTVEAPKDETDMGFSSHVQLVVGLAITRWGLGFTFGWWEKAELRILERRGIAARGLDRKARVGIARAQRQGRISIEGGGFVVG